MQRFVRLLLRCVDSYQAKDPSAENEVFLWYHGRTGRMGIGTFCDFLGVEQFTR
jgi:hypothetical protein